MKKIVSAAHVDERSRPRRLGDVLAEPESTQQQGEDQFGDQERLDDRELSAVKGDRECLEGKGRHSRRPTEEPKRLADREGDQFPATMRVGDTGAGGVLRVIRCTAFARAAARPKQIVTVTSGLAIHRRRPNPERGYPLLPAWGIPAGQSHVPQHISDLLHVQMISLLAKVEGIEVQGTDLGGLGQSDVVLHTVTHVDDVGGFQTERRKRRHAKMAGSGFATPTTAESMIARTDTPCPGPT